MNKHDVLGEIKGFLEGYNSKIKYLVNVETDPRNNYAECIIHEPNEEPRIEKIKYESFMYMKDLSRLGRKLYSNTDESYIESKRIKYGIKITKLKTGNQQRLLDGYCYKITSHRSHNDIINYIRDGGIDIFEKLSDEFGNLVRDKKGKFVYRNRDLFHSVKTTEQFFISTQSRLYKGYEQYKEVHRLTYDIETTGLRYHTARMFAIGVRDNRGFETILEVDKRDDDESEIRLIQDYFNLIDVIRPAVILGHNAEEFDMDFILGRAKILKMNLSQLPNGLKKGFYLKRKGNSSVKYGNTSDKYTATQMWGYSFIDTLHAAKKTAAVNTELKKTNLKYVAKYEKFARDNRTYIKGDDNDIGRYYNENNVFLINEKNQYVELPPEYQEIGRKLYKLQANKDRVNSEQYKGFRKNFLMEDDLINKEKTFIDWYKENCVEKNLITFIGGRKLVHQYLLDDLWETEQVDELYNQSSFMLAKIVPTVYQRICTMGTASIWNLLLTTWSYENDLAIPIPDKFEKFGGGLARTYKKGYSEKIIKIDYASLYPMIQLTHGVFPMFDITGVMQKMLLYMTTTRNIYKKMGAGTDLDNEEVELLKQLDHEAHDKYINGTLTDEDIAMFKVKQLPIKILNNSLYGALGSHISFNWSDNICAAWITSVARLELRHAIHWFSQFGCIALLAVTDGVNFKIPDNTNISVDKNGVTHGVVEAPINKMWVYDGKTGINALIEYFNDTEMIKPYMSVDNDGESSSCLNLARINYATLSPKKDKKTGKITEKIKLTGNSLKSKVMPEYVQTFIDKGLDLILHGKGKEFVEYYYNHAENIRYMQIPLKSIASKSKVKLTLKAYKNRGRDKTGKLKASQAHMELLINERERIAEELFQKHKESLGFTDPEKEPKNIDDKIKLVINYMPPEPEIDSTVYYVNTGKRKSHGDVKKNKETGEVELRCKLISKKDLEDNPDMTGEYNYERYLDAFNKRVCYSDKKIGALLSAFEPETAKKIPIKLVKKGDNAGDLIKGDFNPLKNELELKSFDLDDFDESMYLSETEVAFWNKTGYDPRLVWDGFKTSDNDRIYYEIYEHALNFLNSELEEKNDERRIKSVNDNYKKGDLVLIKNDSDYNIGAYNGVYLQIIRNNVKIPKTDIELELDKINEEKEKKIKELESSELSTKSDREIFLESQAKKKQNYFKEFKQTFNIDLTMTMEKLFEILPDAKKTFEMFMSKAENDFDENVNKYLDAEDSLY
ncbi:MAG: hypothetical protein PF487_15025 [Bacteroidales bacterium]|jgi:DNA polymerase elongation subunit (family B)|nr:hypothetical protein [Bacteroidales bacterium]